MYVAKMSDTGESITGGADMVNGILPIVYRCDSGEVADALEAIDNGAAPQMVYARDWENHRVSWGFLITRYTR